MKSFLIFFLLSSVVYADSLVKPQPIPKYQTPSQFSKSHGIETKTFSTYKYEPIIIQPNVYQPYVPAQVPTSVYDTTSGSIYIWRYGQ